MVASQEHRFATTHDELVALIQWTAESRCVLNVVLGTGELIWAKGEPLPEAVKKLASMRGIGTEGMNGADI